MPSRSVDRKVLWQQIMVHSEDVMASHVGMKPMGPGALALEKNERFELTSTDDGARLSAWTPTWARARGS